MTKIKLLLIMALLLSLTYTLSVNAVTLQNAATTTSLQGSVIGGTKLYFEGLGFSSTMDENLIYIGQFPCILEDGATATSMVCRTSQPDEYKEYYNLPIYVIVGNGDNFLGSITAPQTFSYVFGQTPYINTVTPSVSYGGQGSMVYFYGTHRIIDLGADKDMGDVYGIYIGDSLCSRFGISQDPITPNGNQYIQCYQATLQKAGKYEISEYLFPGRSASWELTYKATLDNNEFFQFVVLPLVNYSTPLGSVNGQDLTIRGTGFSLDTVDVLVSVDGVNCKVSESSFTQVKCKLEPKTTQSTKLQSNATVANLTYNSGVGFFYQRYDTGSSTLDSFKLRLENGSLSQANVVEEYISGEIKTDNVFGSYYGQLWKGYFTPSATGSYRFRGVGDDYFSVYLSKTYGSKVSFVGATPIAFSNVYQVNSLYPNYYLNDIVTAESAYIAMDAGKQYYMEVYQVNNGGNGRFSLSVEVPNNDTTVQRWQTYEVQTITTMTDEDPQIIDFTSSGVTSGTFNLKVFETNSRTLAVVINQTVTIAYNANQTQFCAQLTKFAWFSAYGTTCKLTMKDSTGAVVTNVSLARTFVWRASIAKFRTDAVKNHTFIITYTNAGGVLTITPIQAHSPLISGTFTMDVGGVPVKVLNGSSYSISNIPYNVSTQALKAALQNLNPDFNLMQIERSGDPLTGARWIIYYIGYNKDVLDMNVVGLLTGGRAGQTPNITASTRRNYTSNLFVDPIDYRWMRTASAKPGVIVSVNGIESACNGDCSYTFVSNLPVVTGVNLTGSTVNVNISDPDTAITALKYLTITVDGQKCVNLTGTLTNFNCKLPLNTDNTPILSAGSHLPVVNLASLGILSYDVNITAISANLILTSVTSPQGYTNGGVQVTIVGKGFPASSNDIDFIVCNKICTINSLTNIGAKIVIPSCGTIGNTTITATYKSFSQNVAFTYIDFNNVLQINSISPSSWSPVMKGVMNITGSGFGTDASLLTVYLTNSSGDIYKMKVLSITNSLLKVGIPGGLPGIYDVNVVKQLVGTAVVIPATGNDFSYEVVIISVSPSSGSIGGGTLITITGKNFVADALDTMVSVGNQLNQICRIESITTTQIKCRTPPKNFYYNVSVPQVITVDSKLIVATNCSGAQNCWFTYLSQDVSPMVINASSTTITSGLPLKVNGARFNLSATPMVSLINRITGKVTVVTPSTANDTVLAITVPSVEAGLYAVRARTDPLGQSNMTAVTVSLNIANVSTSGLSTFGGNIKITGSGFPQTWPNQHFNRMSLSTSGRNIAIVVVSMTPTEIVLTIPAGPSGRTFNFSLTSPNGVSKYITFSQLKTGTPKIAIVGTASIDPQVETLIKLNQTNTNSPVSTVLPELIQVYSVSNPNKIFTIQTNYTSNATVISFNVTLNTGKYGFKLFDEVAGWYDTTDVFLTVIKVNTTSYTLDQAVTKTSFNGGAVKINGANIGDGAVITVNGFKGPVVERTATYAIFKVPQLVTPASQTDFKLIKEQKIDLNNMAKFGDSAGFANAFDGQHSSTYVSASAGACFVGVDVGQNLGVQITRIRYFPNPFWNIASVYIQGATVQVSNDNSNWSTIATVDQTVHAGWNSFMIKNQNIFRYVRFSHNNVSKCTISEFQINGIVMSSVTVASTDSLPSNITFDDGISANAKVFQNAVEYTKNTTPIVTGISPDKGDVFGGYNITISGVFLNISEPTVIIDAIPCVVKDKTTTQIICTVGARLSLPQKVMFEVNVGRIPAILQKKFRYVMRWSDPRTWGTDLPPIDDDLVHIPPGMHLLVDQTTPILEGIIVENGTIEFSNEKDMVVSAEFITLRGGEFIAGTEDDDYDYKLTFVMYGNYYSPQQPMFGNKGIGCLECKFSMIGKKRTLTWTVLNTTVNVDENIIVLKEAVDWQIGEHIVIASTSYNHNEAEQRVIVDIINQTVIILDQPLLYKHYSGTENHNGDILEMRAEVGLLTRNIVMMGDDTSVATDYGSHLMLTGSAENGLVGKISYTEFTKCGQPQIMGRYCHHFHMAGDVPDSYSIGNSVHHSMARILTLHGVHFLYVAWNVGYRVKGHNFFIEDGIETNNVLEYNLAISSLLVNNMMQTDMSVASFWITNPSNHLRFNHAAGSDFYGFWYEIKERPDGPSATEDVCPIGNPLGESHDNVAHSNVRFGLRIFKLYSRTNPCEQIRNDGLEDPWSANPSVQSRFYNYQLWKNGEAGLLAEEVGNMIFENFTIAENKMAGMQFYKTNFTKERVVARNIVIIGVSSQNPPNLITQLDGSKGAILSRTGEQTLDNIRFYDFPAGMTVWQACSKCDQVKLYTNTGAQYFASNITYMNINGPYYFMMGNMKRDVFYDVDGSLTRTVFDNQTRGSGTLVYGWPHLLQDSECLPATNGSFWDSAAVCNGTSIVRQVMFTNLIKLLEFSGQSMRVRMLKNGVQQVTSPNETVFTSVLSLQKSKQPKLQKKFTYSLPYLTNRTYDVWWGTHIDFSHLAMITTHQYKSTDFGIVFKFKYIDNRELYEIAPMRQGKPFNNSQLKLPSNSYLDPATCGNGDYYHNNADSVRVLHLCASGRNRTFFEYIDVNAIYCRNLCPAPPGSCTKESTLRYWNNAAQWPGAVLPKAGDNITIPCEWTIILDMVPARIGYFEIIGDVIIPNTTNIDITIEAENIWIKGGALKVGSSAYPLTTKLTIRLLGVQNATGFTVNPQLTGNKMLVNTGRLELFGTPPTTIWTRLTGFANKGATTLKVASTAGWKVGDQLGISPSFSATNEYEKVTITAVNSGTNVTITPALLYAHFGDANPTIVKTYGTLDMRTGVAHLTRNIKIESGNDTTWGFTLIQFGMSEIVGNQTKISTGKMTLSGVEFEKGGQMDTQEAALQIFNVRVDTQHTLITKSSFHDCQDMCMHLLNIYDVEITNNVFFAARKYHVLALETYGYKFTNNLMIGVIKRPSIVFKDFIACYSSYEEVSPKDDDITVTGNLCQGSQGHGFAVTDVNCADMDIYPFAGNTAGSCDIGWIFNKGQGDCLAARNIYAYSCTIGHIMCPVDTVTTKFKNFILADNGRGLTFRIGGSSDDKTAYLYDSYITALARPNCSQCYGITASNCVGNHGIRMLTTGRNGEHLPLKFGHGFDVVCKEETIDGKVFIYNTQFNNFKQTYSTFAQCSSNVIFRPHTGGIDIIGSHHLFNTTCIDCQLGAFAYFQQPDSGDLGWFGGCGDILCTGMNNYLIHDHSGTMLPQKGILLANNSWIGKNTPGCTFYPSMNGYYCTDEDFGVLEYESVAPDFNKRIMWPVYLFFDGGNWTSQTNGWKEWQWNGGQPLNKRIGRFVSVLKLQKMYNMTFKSMPPEDITFKLQKRLPTGNTSDWVIVKLYYPKPNLIRVEVGGQTIKPISLIDNDGEDPLNTSICGSNKFFYKNYTVHFVVTGDPNCLVRVSLTNSIQLTARFEMNINDFFKDDGVTKFINRMAALLKINDVSRIKVVGVYQGSVEVVTFIEPEPVPLSVSTSNSNAAQIAAVASIQAVVSSVINNGSFATAMTSEGFGNVASVTATVITFTPIITNPIDNGGSNNNTITPDNPVDPTNPNQPYIGDDAEEAQKRTTKIVVGVVVGGTCAVCLAVISTIFYLRKKVQIVQISVEELVQMESESHQWASGQTNEKVMLQENSIHQLGSLGKR